MNDVGHDHPSNPQASGVSRRDVQLGAAVLSGPVAWALDLQLSFSGYWWAHWWHTKLPLFALSGVALSVCAGGAWLAAHASAPVAGTDPGTAGRVRFMARLAWGLCALAALVIVAQAVVKVGLGLEG